MVGEVGHLQSGIEEDSLRLLAEGNNCISGGMSCILGVHMYVCAMCEC